MPTSLPPNGPHALRPALLLPLPIDEWVGPFVDELQHAPSGIVTASPGAGKTSVVPREIMAAEWLTNSARPQVILVQPRRVAALQAAERLAAAVGEPIGERVGIRMRGDSRVSKRTQLTVVTEGVFLRMIQQDPGLDEVGVVILDEFHERSLDIDISCALTLSARHLFAPELKLVVMSATLDIESVTALLEPDGPIARLHSEVAQHEVALEYVSLAELPAPLRRYAVSVSERLAEAAADACCNEIRRHQLDGDALIFLPGLHEIRVAARQIERRLPGTTVIELHGRASSTTIERALRQHTTHERRIILSTSLAQTSVTIDGITLVVDTGLIRQPVFDRATGLTRLTTTEISQSTAHQRSGRAGRTRPGRAIRLWTKADHTQRRTHDEPAILQEDLSALCLLLAAWGQSADQLRWCTPPTETDLGLANQLLRLLGAIDQSGALTEQGRRMIKIPAHPRLAAVVATASGDELRAAAALVAMLSEADPWPMGAGPTDIVERVRRVFVDADPTLSRGVIDRLRQIAAQMKEPEGRNARGSSTSKLVEEDLAVIPQLLVHAYPDRIAVRLDDQANRYRFASGLELDLVDPAAFRGAQLIVACDLDADRRSGKIRVASRVSRAQLERWVAGRVDDTSLVEEDTLEHTDGVVVAYRVTTLVVSGLRLDIERNQRALTTADRHSAWLRDIERIGLDAFEWSESAQELAARMRLAHRIDPDHWPQPDAPALLGVLSRSVNARSTRTALPLLNSLIEQSPRSWTFEGLFPTSIVLDSGSTRTINYRDEQGHDSAPTIRVRVQDLFGTTRHPTICDGRISLRLELLSPADRPVAVTDQLNRFWDVGYPGVRSDLRGRYPKHPWPEDPRTAEPRRPRAR